MVDDNDINRTVLVRQLNADAASDFTVLSACNGEEAVAAVTAQESAGEGGAVDLVFMDVEMPVMDGLEATRRIRRYEAASGLAPVPIIGLSGNAREVRQRGGGL